MMDRRNPFAAIATLVICTGSLSTGAAATTDIAGEPLTRSAERYERDRPADAARDTEVLIERATVPEVRRRGSKYSTSRLQSGPALDAWIYDADIELFDDFDADGYYRYFRLWFDADSVYHDHWVYARLLMSADLEYWDEYHVSAEFKLDASSPFDVYEIETELVAGYPTGLYDVLIELYDADSGVLLAEYGPADSSAFSLLPLEDAQFDAVPPPVVTTTVVHGGGGSIGWIGLAVLTGVLYCRRRRRLPTSAAKSHAAELRSQAEHGLGVGLIKRL